MILIAKSNVYSTGFNVQLIFQLTQDKRDEKLLTSFIDFFECGNVYQVKTWCDFRRTKLSDIIKKVIPFIKNYPIEGVKAEDFEDWCKVAELMKEKNI